MNRKEFNRYMEKFNARDYDGAIEFFTDDITIKFAGYIISGKSGFKDFYSFFHEYVNEKIIISQFAGDDENIILDVIVRLTGIKVLTEEILKEKGYERLGALSVGEVADKPQFIHYRIENEKFKEIRCVLKEEMKI